MQSNGTIADKSVLELMRLWFLLLAKVLGVPASGVFVLAVAAQRGLNNASFQWTDSF